MPIYVDSAGTTICKDEQLSSNHPVKIHLFDSSPADLLLCMYVCPSSSSSHQCEHCHSLVPCCRCGEGDRRSLSCCRWQCPRETELKASFAASYVCDWPPWSVWWNWWDGERVLLLHVWSFDGPACPHAAEGEGGEWTWMDQGKMRGRSRTVTATGCGCSGRTDWSLCIEGYFTQVVSLVKCFHSANIFTAYCLLFSGCVLECVCARPLMTFNSKQLPKCLPNVNEDIE